MAFDPDWATYGMPDFCASQQPITIQSDVEPKTYSWSYKVGSKTLENGTTVDEYKQFNMFRYRCDWAINIWLSGTEQESMGEIWSNVWGHGGVVPNYAGALLWIRLVPRAFVYFKDNPDQVFFAPAYIGLAENVHWVGVDKDGKKIDPDPAIISSEDMNPKAQGETVGIYYKRGGGEIITEDKLLSYEGTLLDSEIFRTEYWMRLYFSQFTPLSWYEWGLWHNWKFPSAYIKFVIYLFVVGEWTVYIKTGEIPALEPHTPIVRVYNPVTDWISSIVDAIHNWFVGVADMILGGFWAFLPIILIVVGIILVIIFSPAIASWLKHKH